MWGRSGAGTTGTGAVWAPASIALAASDAVLAAKARGALEREGHRVRLFQSSGDLLEALDRGRADLVLLAFDAMESDGFSVCRQLRALSQGEALPILVLCPEDERAIAQAFDAGANELLTTPVNWALFRHRVTNLLRASRLLAELRTSRASLESAQRIAILGSWELEWRSQDMRWSPQLFHILGLKPGEVKTDLENFRLCMHPQDRDDVTRQMEEAVGAGRSFDIAYRLMQGSGAVRHVQLRGELVETPGAVRVLGTLQDVTEQRRTQEKIRYLAHYDSLTGLSNRRRFKEQLQRALDRARLDRRPMALLYMDLDQFKRINDTLGHNAGDRLLQHVADVLFDKVRATDIVGRVVRDDDVEVSRLGGDEFAVVLSELNSPQDAGQVASRILSAVTAPIQFENQALSTTASIGIAVYPEDGDDPDELVKHADIAMYAAKERGRNMYQLYSETQDSGTLRKLNLETQLREALERDELRVVYQPRADLRTRQIVGAEALLRWEHPEMGGVLPKEFIPVAEDTGLIVPIGEWVLRTACEQARAWRTAGLGTVRISVNVSSRQFIHHDLRGTVTNALRGSGLNPRQLELEITESVVLEDDAGTDEALRELNAMGVRIALDDFGTGYSSLSYLTKFPLDTLKLDRSLVREVGTNPSSLGIATAVIAMAHAVDLRVTAEGVDDAEQARALLDQGCDELQGFLIAAPLPAEECAAYLADEGRGAPVDWESLLGPQTGGGPLPADPGPELPAARPRRR